MPTARAWVLGVNLLLAGGLAAAPAAAGAADLEEVKSRGALRVLRVESGRDEFFCLEPGEPPGFDHEVLQGFARLHRLRLEPVSLSTWDALIPQLLLSRGDLIAGRFTATDGRRRLIAFTPEVFPSRNVVLTRKPHRVVGTLEALRAERVGTVRGTSMAEAVAAAGVAPDQVVDSIPPGGLPAALRAGRVTAIVLGIESAITAQREDPQLELGLFLGPPASLAYGVRKEDTTLLRALDDYIENLRHTPTWSRLVVKYFGPSAVEILRKARQK